MVCLAESGRRLVVAPAVLRFVAEQPAGFVDAERRLGAGQLAGDRDARKVVGDQLRRGFS
jgi:hypothetical protein